MRDWLAAVPAPVAIAMEATLFWQWLVARLQEAGHTALVADAYQIKLIWQARSKTDIIDARKLAPGPVGGVLSPSAAGERQTESDQRRRAETVCVSLLDAEGGVDVRAVVRPTRGKSKTGGAPESTFGSGWRRAPCHSPGNANGPPPSNTRSCLPDAEALEDDFDEVALDLRWRRSCRFILTG